MHFASDNTAGASARILDAIVAANRDVLSSYGTDPHTRRAEALLRDTFGCDLAAVLVTTGTAANSLALAALVPPSSVVFCHEGAHIIEEECAGPEFFIGSGKLVGVAGANGKIDPAAFAAKLKRFPRGVVRQAQPSCLSLSQVTESGTLYTLDEVRTLANMAHAAGLTVHMDGARFGNAVAALGCSPAALTHEAGVDALSFGATKNGALACEAVLIFDKGRAATLPFLQKRGGHVLSKGRLLGSQMAAYLEGGHWLELARRANARAGRLAAGLAEVPGVRLPWATQANEVFPILPQGLAERLKSAGAVFYDWEQAYLTTDQLPGPDEAFVRLICSHATTEDEVESLLRIAQAA